MKTHSERVILLVEDSRDDQTLALRALDRAKVANEVVVVNDGVEALDYLMGPAAKPLPAVVLLDLKLPKIDGLEVLKRIRAEPRTARVPVVILTASSEERDLVVGYDLGANSYIRKPVDFLQFAEAIRQLGIYWLVLNEPPPLET